MKKRYPYTITLITPYQYLGELFSKISNEKCINTIVKVAAFEDAVKIAKDLENQVDIFISRGGTADYIRNAVQTPVVSIPVTAFEIMKAIHKAKKISNEVAFITYQDNIFGVNDIQEILQVKIHISYFMSEDDIEEKVKVIKNKGIKVVIGGAQTVVIAEKYGIKGILVECEEESAFQTLEEALRIVEVRNAEIKRSARLKTILNSITEGIIVTNEENKIEVCNPAAEKIFRISSKSIVGEPVFHIIPNTRMHKVLESGDSEFGDIQEINGGIIATNRVPVETEGQRIGVVSTFSDVTKIQMLEQKIREKMSKKGFIAKHTFSDILTANKDMIERKKLAEIYAKTDGAILIQGESGTGKELFAQSIHNASNRASGPFVAVNCAAIHENLLESELFGYEGGAFSGAKKEGKQGLFELAHNGTIFLDEIGEVSKGIQSRLLRVIQEKEIMRVGGNNIIPVNIRIISATNQNLKKQIECGEFRQDLYYRLNVFNILIPPLRERKEDTKLIATKLLKNFVGNSINLDFAIAQINRLLISYDWPGNVRELHNIIERVSLVLLNNSSDEWPEILSKVIHTSEPNDNYISLKVNINKGLNDAVKEIEKEIIKILLTKHNHDKDKVIEELKIGRATFWRKIK